jgi:hypothetical protein
MLRSATAAAILTSLLAACGEGDGEGGGTRDPRPAPAAEAADLTVVVRPEGRRGPVRTRDVECDRLGAKADEKICRNLTAEQLAPVPGNVACTAIYGGPAVARVTGTLRGERVDERFSLEDGCQIARWERNRDLLGPPGRGP